MVLLLGAIDGEVRSFVDAAEIREKRMWNAFPEYKAGLAGKEVLIAVTGVGKVLSALSAEHLIECYRPEYIIFAGLAGAISDRLDTGDVLLAEDCLQYDLDAGIFGYKTGQIPYTPYRFLASDRRMLDLAAQCRLDGCRLIKGRVLTGDQFISADKRAIYDRLFSSLQGDAVDMEGASIALAAAVNGIPFLLIRIISDKADGKAPGNFRAILEDAGRKSLTVVSHLLKTL